MSAVNSKEILAYNGYHRVSDADDDAGLTHVGPGTPCGEYLRRFWQPVCMSDRLNDLPLAIRIMGEDLVVFRDLSGQVGVLHRQCSHRRTSLEYGVIAEHGIRCCYHGWLFDVDGRILETPGEPEDSPIKNSLYHGAYPALEYKGLVFSYMGPPEEKPAFPIYDTMERKDNLTVPYEIDMDCNWLQVQEQPMDPFHSVFLHTRMTGPQFYESWGAYSQTEFRKLPDNTGLFVTNSRRWEEFVWVRLNELFVPNFSQPADIYQNPDREKFFPRAAITTWTVPVDDTHCKIVAWRHYNDELDAGGRGDPKKCGHNTIDYMGQTKYERTYEEGQRYPGDYEALVAQGPIAKRKLEHLGHTDTGVAMLRQLISRSISDVKKGKNPPRMKCHEDGLVHTLSCDVIVNLPQKGNDEEDAKFRKKFGRNVANIVLETQQLTYEERKVEVERRVKELKAEVA